MTTPAVLVLADGSVFNGTSIGAEGQAVGEVVINTSMVGYQEVITNPVYRKKMVAFTYPHIGNTGVNAEDEESNQAHITGLIIRDLPLLESNFRSSDNLANYLKQHNIVGIAEIDTRRLTRIIREKGQQAGCIAVGNDINIAKLQEIAQAFNETDDKDLINEVTCAKAYEWTEGTWNIEKGFQTPNNVNQHVVVYDFGVTKNALRILAMQGCRLTVVPANTSADLVLAMNPQGIVLSDGPGNPAVYQDKIAIVKALLESKKPICGLGLGHQLIALAIGSKTQKLNIGYYGVNHPVKVIANNNVVITNQNYNYEITEASLPSHAEITHRSMFDQSVQGLQFNNQPVFSYQQTLEEAGAAKLLNEFIMSMQGK